MPTTKITRYIKNSQLLGAKSHIKRIEAPCRFLRDILKEIEEELEGEREIRSEEASDRIEARLSIGSKIDNRTEAKCWAKEDMRKQRRLRMWGPVRRFYLLRSLRMYMHLERLGVVG